MRRMDAPVVVDALSLVRVPLVRSSIVHSIVHCAIKQHVHHQVDELHPILPFCSSRSTSQQTKSDISSQRAGSARIATVNAAEEGASSCSQRLVHNAINPDADRKSPRTGREAHEAEWRLSCRHTQGRCTPHKGPQVTARLLDHHCAANLHCGHSSPLCLELGPAFQAFWENSSTKQPERSSR